MDQRLKNLEDLNELIIKEIVQQNRNTIEMNKNLLFEIKSLREAYIKQDEDFEEFKNLLKKIYDLNKQQLASGQQGAMQNPTQFMYPGLSHPPLSSQSSVSNQLPPSHSYNSLSANANVNASYMTEQVNQSMLNNVSFQSERTPLHNQQQSANSYSVPNSASAMMFPQQQQQFTPYTSGQMTSAQPQLANSQKPSTKLCSYPVMPVTTSVMYGQQLQSQQQQYPGAHTSNQTGIKPLPQQMVNMQQPPPVKPFSFSNLNKPQVSQNGTDAVKLEQQNQHQRQVFNPPPPTAQSTSTPQPSQLFPTSKLQPAQQQDVKSKPPQFQFSPAKQVETSTSTLKPFSSLPPSTSAPTIAAPSGIFSGNLFKAATTTPEKKSSLFAPPPLTSSVSQPAMKTTEEENDEAAGHNPEEFEPQVDFKPIVKLQEVETKTGEEDEAVLLKARCKLFRFDLTTKEWKEKGLGDIKFLEHRVTGVTRLLMRREQVLKICANHRLGAGMTIKELSPKQFSWTATDFSDNEAKTELLLAKFKTEEDAAAFKKQFEKSVEKSKSLTATPSKTAPAPAKAQTENKLSQMFKDDGSWNCTACYAPNKKDIIKCACCSTLKPGATEPAPTKPESTTTTTNQFSFGLQPAKQTSPQKPFSFGMKKAEDAPAVSPFSFGAKAPSQPPLDFSAKQAGSSTSPSKPATGLFGAKPMPSFGDLAASAPGGSLFGGPTSATNAFTGGIKAPPAKPFFSSAFQTPKEAVAEDEGNATENPEEYEPQVDFKPIVKLQEVETKTGEENEIELFKMRCKLYRFEKKSSEWKEKGTGEIKILRHKDHENMHRILMRRDQVLKICANHRITSDLSFEIFNEKQVRWHADDYAEGTSHHETLAARFKLEADAKRFKELCDNALRILALEPTTNKPTDKPAEKPETNACQGLQSTLSQMFKDDGSWNCTACYAPNKKDIIKCACCSTLKPGATEPAASAEKSVTSSLSKISFGAPSADAKAAPVLFGNVANKDEKSKSVFDFGSNSPFSTTNSNKSIFGAPPAANMFGKSESPKTDVASIFGAKPGATFADLAQKTQPSGFSGGFIGSGFTTGESKAKPLFGSVFGKPQVTTETQPDEEATGDNPEEYEPQVDFKPIVKLNEVQTKTGEEDETVLLKLRCKLFRFNQDTKEWKEKGLGDIKLLQHKLKENTYRILMRREQVLKLCANHRITPSLKLENVTEKQITWYVQDCSEEEPRAEILLAKFRHEEEATKFKVEVEKIQKLLLANPSSAESSCAPRATEQASNKISSLVKKSAEGSWKCDGCLALNKPEAVKCACCENAKPNIDNENVIIIQTVEATKEQVEKARKFQLPDNFYLYEKCAECKGCRGCEEDNK